MGKMLVIKGADFSTNGTPIVDPDIEKLNAIKTAIEAKYYEHLRYANANTVQNPPSQSGNTRNSFGNLNASVNGLSPFVVTPKNGCKIVPLQSAGSTGIFPFTWTTDAVTFTNFETYPYIGANIAYSNDAEIPSNTSIWDFIDIALAE